MDFFTVYSTWVLDNFRRAAPGGIRKPGHRYDTTFKHSQFSTGNALQVVDFLHLQSFESKPLFNVRKAMNYLNHSLTGSCD